MTKYIELTESLCEQAPQLYGEHVMRLYLVELTALAERTAQTSAYSDGFTIANLNENL